MGKTAGNRHSEREKRSKFARQFERAVKRARVVGLVERSWQRTAPTVGALTGIFLTASWGGLWQNVTPSVRMTGALLFTAALAAAVAPLRNIRRSTREEALVRLSEKTGRTDRPAETYDDIPADPEADEDTQMIWDLQRARIERNVGKFKAGAPNLSLKKRDPFYVRYALVLAAALTFTGAYSQNEHIERITEALNWDLGTIDWNARIDAWVTPPDYTGEKVIPLSNRQKGLASVDRNDIAIPAGSVLTLRVHEKDSKISVKGGTTNIKEACSKAGQEGPTRCEFELASNASITILRRGGRNINWKFNVLPDRPPVVSVTPAEKDEAEQKGDTELRYELRDEYGAEITEGRITPAEKIEKDPDAKPLPAYNLPKIKVPAR